MGLRPTNRDEIPVTCHSERQRGMWFCSRQSGFLVAALLGMTGVGDFRGSESGFLRRQRRTVLQVLAALSRRQGKLATRLFGSLLSTLLLFPLALAQTQPAWMASFQQAYQQLQNGNVAAGTEQIAALRK